MNTNNLSSNNLPNICGSVDIDILSVSHHNAVLRFLDFSLEKYNSVRFLVLSQKNSECIYITSDLYPEEKMNLNLSQMEDLMQYKSTQTFQLMAEFQSDENTFLYELETNKKDVDLEENKYYFIEDFYFSEDDNTNPTEYIGMLFFNTEKKACVVLGGRNYIFYSTHTCFLQNISMKNGVLKIKFNLETGDYKYIKTSLVFRNKLASEAVSYDFNTLKTTGKKNVLQVTAALDLKELSFKSLYWDVIVKVCSPKGKECYTFISMDALQRIYNKFFFDSSYTEENGFFLYPYYTGRKELAFVYRKKGKYDGLDIIFKELFSVFIYRLTKPYWKKKHICLVCEKFSSMAQDNGYYFFKHCMEKNEEEFLNKKIYYVITKDSPDHYKIDDYKNRIIDFMSMRHIIYTLAADLIVGSDSKYHSYALYCRHSIFNRYIKKVPSVFLQHGVTALKKVDRFYGKNQKARCDLFVVTSDFEKKIITDNFGYEAEEVAVTGFARWDVLQNKVSDTREILVMPTWRNWLDSVPDETFIQSDYFCNYMKLLNSKRLAELLEENDLRLNFYLHAKFQNYLSTFDIKSDRINILSFEETPVNEMLMRCCMLITDYSSVSWDILYLGKPTIFYQFDLDQYEEAQGSYIDMRTDLFGDRAENQEQLFTILEEHIRDEFKLKPEYQKRRAEYFNFKDHQHSRQICEAIKKRFQ